MKTKKALRTYFYQRSEDLQKLLKKAPDQFTIADFHLLRVEIKKLRALAELLDSSEEKIKAREELKPLNEIFGEAGKIREIQLEAAMIRQHRLQPPPKAYLDKLHNEELKRRKKFVELHNDFPLKRKRLHKLVLPAIKLARKKRLVKFVLDNKKTIVKLLSPLKLKTANLHLVRKKMKQIFYNIKSMGVNEDSLALKKGDQLLELIGQWHDAKVMKSHLQKVLAKDRAPLTDKKKITLLVDKMTAKSQKLYARINEEKQGNLFLRFTI